MNIRLAPIAAVLAVAAPLTFPQAAFADARATASFSDIVLAVTDLTPDDANASGVEVAESLTHLFVLINQQGTSSTTRNLDLDNLASGSIDLVLDNASSVAAADGGLGATAAESAAFGTPPGWIGTAARTEQINQVILSPYSLLTITGHVSSHSWWVADDPGTPAYDYRSGAYFAVRLSDYQGAISQLTRSWSTSEVVSDVRGGENFSLTFTNDTAEYRQLGLAFLAGTDAGLSIASGPVSPVPEPAAFMTYLTGLVLLAGAAIGHARRRLTTAVASNGLSRCLIRTQRMLGLGAAAVLLSPGFAHAALTTMVSIEDVTVTIVDLSPDDGIPAGWDVSAWSRHLVVASDRERTVSREMQLFGLSSGSIDVGLEHSSATGSALGGLAMLSARAIATDNGTGVSFAQSHNEQTADITLHPFSLMTITGRHLSSTAWDEPASELVTDVYGGTYCWIYLMREGSAQAVIAERNTDFKWPGDMTSAGGEGQFAATITNDTHEYLTLSLRVGTGSWAQVSAVPEPAAFATLGAGLLVLAVARRRQRRR